VNYRSLLLLALSTPFMGLATTPGPGDAQCGVLNKISAMATAQPTMSAALGVLEQIAKAGNQAISADTEKKLGLTPGDLRHPAYNDVGVRVCALHSLGRTGLPEAVDFLRNFSLADIAGDNSNRIWPAAQIALREALLGGITDAKSRAEFLENVLTEHHDARSNSSLLFWAAEQLCDQGASQALPQVRASFKWLWPEQQFAADQITFCEDRMQVLSRDVDRAMALGTVFGSVVSLEGSAEGRRLLEWATWQLAAIQSDSATAELERVAGQLVALQKSSPGDLELSELAENINDLRTARKK
jgi:hypothetical protein